MYGGKPCLGKTEMKEVRCRISRIDQEPGPIMGVLADLPLPIKLHIGDHETFKVEWMLNGQYMCAMSESYGMNFMTEKTMVEIARIHGLPPKIVDGIGLDDYDIAYRMWVETVFSPCTSVTYTCPGIWMTDKRVCYTTVRMVSLVINHTYIITGTTAGRGKIYTF